MLNSAPLNSWPLNALAGGAEHDDPIVIDPPQPPAPPLPGDGVYPGFPVPPPAAGHSFRWSAVVTLGGVDVTELLTGSIRVDREEGASGIAEFSLYYPLGSAVPTDMDERTVAIDYITQAQDDSTQVRLFTGYVAEPSWDAVARVMRITATDNLQQRVEAMSVTQIETLTAGVWSEDVFSPLQGRSRWDYAQERMRSRTASLDCSAEGAIRVTSWHARTTPHYIFGVGTTVFESVSVDLAQTRRVTNRVELEIGYRYSRLHQKNINYRWHNPSGDFCSWLSGYTFELPTTNMVIDATKSAGFVPIKAQWQILPPTQPDPCGFGSAWINNFPNLLLGAEWTAAKRWDQSVTETYAVTLTTTAGQIEGQQVISRTRISVDASTKNEWASSLVEINADPSIISPAPPQKGVKGDLPNEPRRRLAIQCAMQVAHTDIIDAHRKTIVSWDVPTSLALGVDTVHTVEINDQHTKARAKCSRRVDRLDFESGSAITTISIAVMRGGGISDALVVPDRLGAENDSGGGGEVPANILATQLGGRFTSPEYDDELDGFAGNYSSRQDSTLPIFPRRMAVTAPAIAEDLRDEKTYTGSTMYRVGVPNDLLEL